MDNLDGKQARRTKNSTALGEIFDHGCDSLFLLFTVTPLGNGMNLDPLEIFIVMVIGCSVFYCSHWEEYFTGNLILGYVANPTEIQWYFIFTYMLTSFTGVEWWTEMQEVYGFLYKRNTWVIIMFSVSITICVLHNMYTGYNHFRVSHKEKPIFAFFEPVLPFFIATLLMSLWVYLSSFGYNILKVNTIQVISIYGLLFSFYCNQLVISRIFKMRVHWNNPINIIPLAGIISNLVGMEDKALPILLFILVALFINFVLSVTWQLSDFLNIRVFHIIDNNEDEKKNKLGFI